MRVNIQKSALKDLKKIAEPDKSRVNKGVINLQNYPNISNIKKLFNFKQGYRLRVGNYRILFDLVDDDLLKIARVLHRKESYKQ